MADRLAELEAYFAGELSGAMGLRSSLGPMLEYGAVMPSSSPSPPEPTGGALAAARSASRVEETLGMLTVDERAVLAAFYAPRGGGAPLDRVVNRDGRAERVEAIGGGLRVALGEVFAVACVIAPVEKLRELSEAVSRKGPEHTEERREARRRLRQIAGRSHGAVRRALDAYERAGEECRQRRREGRRERFRRSLG